MTNQKNMSAMVIESLGAITESEPCLVENTLPVPTPGRAEVLVKVHCCAVCHTEMDEIEGRLPPAKLPCVPGHQVVGIVVALGGDVSLVELGDRVGIAWIYNSCGHCEYCDADNDNLCEKFMATGKDANGGYAEYIVVPEKYAFRIPDSITDIHAAPLLCAGAIGYRSLRLTGLENGQTLGMTGFGASAHLMMKIIQHLFPDSPVYVFARHSEEQDFALSLGAIWAGGTDAVPPEACHAIVDTTPAWFPIVKAMECLRPGGRLVINAIRKEAGDQSSLQSLNYETHLWREKELKTVANVSRRDVSEFLELAATMQIEPEVKTYALSDANLALQEMKFKPVKGAKVLICS